MCAAQSTQNPAYIAYSLNLGFVLRSGTFGWRHSMCGTHFHTTCKFPQNSPRNRSRAKVPDPIRHLKMAFYQGFFKILVPGGHSLGRGIRTPPHSKFQSVTMILQTCIGHLHFMSYWRFLDFLAGKVFHLPSLVSVLGGLCVEPSAKDSLTRLHKGSASQRTAT